MKSLSVSMNGYLTGSLIQQNNGGNTVVYHPDWLALEGARPLSLSRYRCAEKNMKAMAGRVSSAL
ncbi:hypothetical protein [Pantoea sp. BAV 3049]|uniref:hypothetical protein n=1 Tax=Pantoea sp. BAV 3049 TaxID=2654188 RepID=UPI00131A8C55|nr:hypothetical protein [Pantoea sp. BAV 3049]